MRPEGRVLPQTDTMGLMTSAVLRTDVGVVRERNEDSAHVDERGRFVIVADGRGGHGAGDIASALAVELVRESMDAEGALIAAYADDPKESGRTLLGAQMRRALERANTEVYERSEREPDKHQMGSTLELVVLAGNEALIAHVGDSRVYLVRNGKAVQVTVDHTVAETMRRAGTLSEDEAQVSPMRSVLSNAIGVTPTVSVDLVRLTMKPGDRLLVCSDGLHDYFSPAELAVHLTGDDPDTTLARMIEHVREAGGHDNMTGIIVEAIGRPAATHPGLAEVQDPLDDQPTVPVSVPEPTPAPAPAPITAERARRRDRVDRRSPAARAEPADRGPQGRPDESRLLVR
jgi:serine/threonine protein phosphatase PrpC